MLQTKKILLIRSARTPAVIRLTNYAEQLGWHLQVAEYTTNSIDAFCIDNGGTYPDPRQLIDFWKPDGCIVDCGAAPSVFSARDFAGIPTVFMDRDPESIEDGAHCVHSDAAEIAEVAARELLQTGFDHFVCIEFPEDHQWNTLRSQHFQRFIRQNGKSVTNYRLPKFRPYDLASSQLVKFLSGLPRPVGIFAINDAVGKLVIDAGLLIGAHIPNDFTVISVDNNIDFCERHPISMTSIELDVASCGQLAGQLLNSLLTGQAIGHASRAYKVARIVHRASAPGTILKDPRFLTGLEYIRLHATDGINVSDVVEKMGCSRRSAYALFFQNSDRTILDEIQLRRIEAAKSLLADNTLTIDLVARMCGFENDCDFRRVFKRYTSLTPTAWRGKGMSCEG